jgi:MFS family permease
LLALINSVLGVAVLSVPIASAFGRVSLVHLFAVGALFGFLKMANWAGVPSILPSFISDPDELATANAMESISFGIADVAGPGVAGGLIALVGAAWVLGVDAITFGVFVVALLLLPREVPLQRAQGTRGLQLGPAVRFVWEEKAILATTIMFMSANIGGGMIMVFIPLYAVKVLGGGPGTFGIMLSSLALAETIGAVVLGSMKWRYPLGRSIAAAQALAGLSFLFFFLLKLRLSGALVVVVVGGVLSSPLTIWAQTLRMQRIPAEMRGRVFGLLRTTMQSTTPLGGAVAAYLVPHGMRLTALVIGLVIAVPGMVGLVIRSLSPVNADGR